MTNPPDQNAQYYLLKNGYYFRPDSRGYTAHASEAGLFDKEYAEKYAACPSGQIKMLLKPVAAPALPDAPARGGEKSRNAQEIKASIDWFNARRADLPHGATWYLDTLIQSAQREVTGEESILKEIVEEAKTSRSGSRATGPDADEWQDYVEIPKSLIDKALAIISGKEG